MHSVDKYIIKLSAYATAIVPILADWLMLLTIIILTWYAATNGIF